MSSTHPALRSRTSPSAYLGEPHYDNNNDEQPTTRDYAASNDSSTNTSTVELPPPRRTKPMRSVSPPLSNMRLNRFIYALLLLTTLLGAYYSYRVVQYKTDVGGWWNLAVGKRPPQALHTPTGPGGGNPVPLDQVKSPRSAGTRRTKKQHDEDSVEDRINALAKALGMPSRELASAIALAVRQYVPPASLSSVAAQESGPAVEALIKGVSEDVVAEQVQMKNGHAAEPTGVMGGVVSGIESFVGMDEP